MFFLALFLGLISSASQAQSVTILANTTTPNGTDQAGDVINYFAYVSNTGAIALNNVSFSDSLGTALTLDSGDTNTNNILDPKECWVYKSLYSVTTTNVSVGTIQNTFSLNKNCYKILSY